MSMGRINKAVHINNTRKNGAHERQPLNVLVFGDSQGDVGPTFKVLRDVLTFNGVPNTVVNRAVGGTSACHWASDPEALAKAAASAFPAGPDYVWYSAGGNDLAQDETYHKCLERASNDDEALQCLAAANSKALACTTTLFEHLWAKFPNARLGQYNYEVPCVEGACVEAASAFIGGAYCKGQLPCMISAMQYWQSIYVDALQARYPRPSYTGMNILGAVQQASGVAGASRGHPVLTAGSKCDWMVECVHPKYRTPTATAVGTALWDLWLKDALPIPVAPSPPPAPEGKHGALSGGEVAGIATAAVACLALLLAAAWRGCKRRGRTVDLRDGLSRLQEVVPAAGVAHDTAQE